MESFSGAQTYKNFQVESDPFFGHLWNQTLIGLTKPGRHFGLGASRHMQKTPVIAVEIVAQYVQDVRSSPAMDSF